MEIYAVFVTVIALFFIFDNISLRLERSEDWNELWKLNLDVDEYLEKISQLEEEVRRWNLNYQAMGYKNRKYVKFFMDLMIELSPTYTKVKIDQFFKKELSVNKYNKARKWSTQPK